MHNKEKHKLSWNGDDVSSEGDNSRWNNSTLGELMLSWSQFRRAWSKPEVNDSEWGCPSTQNVKVYSKRLRKSCCCVKTQKGTMFLSLGCDRINCVLYFIVCSVYIWCQIQTKSVLKQTFYLN